MKILVIGSGGREHALCERLAASASCEAVLCAPGNPGMLPIATLADLDTGDHQAITRFVRAEQIGLVVIGPEAPLMAGLADDLAADGIPVFGPTAAAARLEGSKAFTKALCQRHGIPTAAFETFTDADSAREYVRRHGAPIVVKADGLAAGKGVVVAATIDEAITAIDEAMIGQAFGEAGHRLVIEEVLTGREASFFALVDGAKAIPLAGAHDYKRAFDGDRGPNTGGMGAVSPTPRLGPGDERRVMEEIILPTARAMVELGCPFRGVLYAGLMMTASGPSIIEYNARFGDPECQAIMPRLEGDLATALLAVATGRLETVQLEQSNRTAVCVVLASKGYPGPYSKGSTISGLDGTSGKKNVPIYHAGTALDAAGRLIATGGRVLGVTGLGGDVAEARRYAYETVDGINWPEGIYRRDIGTDA